MTQMCDLTSIKRRRIQKHLVVDLVSYGCMIKKWPQMAKIN
jgi:hypothetical protein